MTATRAPGSEQPACSAASTTKTPGLVMSAFGTRARSTTATPFSLNTSTNRLAEPALSAHSATVQPSPTSPRTRAAVASASAVAGPQPLAAMIGALGASAGNTSDTVRDDDVASSSRSVSTCRRGNSRSASRAQVDASARARSASSASRSTARVCMRRGSTSTSRVSVPSTSVRSSSRSTSQGSQLSIPSNC